MKPEKLLLLFLCFISVSCSGTERDTPALPDDKRYFTNPLRETGADPWVIQHEGKYYMSESDGNQRVYISESTTIMGLKSAVNQLVFDFSNLPANEKKYAVWGPHLNYIKGKWYIYYCAQSSNDTEFKSQRMWVLRSQTNSPYGPYEDAGEVVDSGDTEWAIDGSVLERSNGDLYFVWSGITDLTTLHQKTFIAKMISPTKVERATIVNISNPTNDWETSVRPIQEGQRPIIVDVNGKTIIMFSANASWTDEYCLGSLTNTDGNFLNPASWVKSSQPLFKKNASVFGPGGASYIKSVDNKQSWIIYHAAKRKGSGWDRQIRMQPFTWKDSGDPFLGEPVGENVKLEVPSGE